MILKRSVPSQALILLASLFAIFFGSTEISAQQRELVNGGTVGLIIGSAESSDVALASDLVTALNNGYAMRVLPVLGQGSVRNVEDLLYLQGIDVALVQADVLEFYRRTGSIEDLEQRIRYIAKLASEEVHVLARDEITSINDLDGRRVNFGVDGSGSFLTAGILFDQLGLDVDVTTFALPAALKELHEGTIDSLVTVSAAPLDQLRLLDQNTGFHFLSVSEPNIGDTYQIAELSSNDYPNLVASGQRVATIAVAKILTAYNWPIDHPRGEKLSRFVERLFERADVLAKPPFHPKWREIDLLEPLPGWQRLPAAATWIAQQR